MNDDLIPISQLDYDDVDEMIPIAQLDYDDVDEMIPISQLDYDDVDEMIPISQLDYDDVDEVIPISELFFHDVGPHIFPAGVATPPRYTPARGRELQDLLGTTITQLGGVSGGTRRTPVPAPPPVPIESLLYRGRAALDRALEIRSARMAGELTAPEAMEELFDLIALASEE